MHAISGPCDRLSEGLEGSYDFPIRQRRAAVLLLLICSTVSLRAQENHRRSPELDKTPVAAKTKPNIVARQLSDGRKHGVWENVSFDPGIGVEARKVSANSLAKEQSILR
jgi:hypothetical protein